MAIWHAGIVLVSMILNYFLLIMLDCTHEELGNEVLTPKALTRHTYSIDGRYDYSIL